MTVLLNRAPYQRTSRNFPDDVSTLSREINKAYLEIAANINVRTIGVFPTNVAMVTGETWYFDKNQKQQSLRQAFFFTSTASIPHGLNFSRLSVFSRCFGEYTDGTNWYGLINGTSVAIPGQISFYVDPTNIVFVLGVGAPVLSKGNIVLEWISDV
jgi:hypothetical protein